MSFAPRFARFEHDVLPKVVVPALATLLLLAASHTGAQAVTNTLVVTDAEGYGIMDCLTDGKACGRIVADAWCEAHGMGPAQAYGRASDVTAAIPVSMEPANRIPDTATVVACAD